MANCQTTPTTTTTSSSTTNTTLGSGVIAIICFTVLGLILCIAGKCLKPPLPMIMTIVGTALPVIVFIIIYAWPKQVDKPVGSVVDKDTYRVLRILFSILIVLGAVAALLFGCMLEILKEHRAQVSDVGFSVIENIFRRTRKQKSTKRTSSKSRLGGLHDLTRPRVEERSYKKVFRDIINEKEKQWEDDFKSGAPRNIYTDFNIDERVSKSKPDLNMRRTMDMGGAQIEQPREPMRVLTSAGDGMYHGYPLEDTGNRQEEFGPSRGLPALKTSSKKNCSNGKWIPTPEKTAG